VAGELVVVNPKAVGAADLYVDEAVGWFGFFAVAEFIEPNSKEPAGSRRYEWRGGRKGGSKIERGIGVAALVEGL
jgi:hypothetical protein